MQSAAADCAHLLIQVAIRSAAAPPAPEVCRLKNCASDLLQASCVRKEGILFAACSNGLFYCCRQGPRDPTPHRRCVSLQHVDTQANLMPSQREN